MTLGGAAHVAAAHCPNEPTLAAVCAASPSVIAGQYATSNCKPLLVKQTNRLQKLGLDLYLEKTFSCSHKKW